MATENVNLSGYDKSQLPDASGYRVVLVTSSWNAEITDNLKAGARAALEDCGIPSPSITDLSVPGSFELPMGAQMALRDGKVDAVICLGSVIRGETAHFDYVCQACADGIQRVSLVSGKPVIFGVLTDDNIEQSRARSGGKHGNKGIEAAITAIQMIALNKAHDGSQREKLGF